MPKQKKYIILLCGYSGAISGGDEHALQLTSYLSTFDNDITVILPKDAYLDRIESNVRRVNLPNLFFEEKIRHIKPLLLLVYMWRIVIAWYKLKKMKGSKDHIIIAASHLFHDTFPLLLQNKHDSEFIYAYHLIRFCNSRTGISTRISVFLERLSLWVVASRNINVITSSDVVKTQLIGILPNTADRFRLTRNGVNIDMIQKVEPQAKTIDVVFCGRFVAHKGVLDLVNAISRITKDIPIKAVLIGRGPELNKIKKLINTLQLEQVLIATDADDHEKFRLIKSAKLFVLPSYEEGWGIVIGEALACGTNVLAYDVKEIQTMWGDSVTWVEKGNIDMLATGIQDILAAPPLRTDEDFWQTALSWENILDEEVNYFDSAKSIEQ